MMRAFSKRGNVYIAAVALVLACFLVLAGCGGGKKTGGKNLAIGDVKLDASDLGSGWRLEDEVWVDPSKAEPGSKFDMLAEIGAKKILNQIFTRQGERLQVNLVELPGTDDAVAAASLMTEEGGENLCGSVENIAVELIGEEASKEKAAELLGIETEGEPGDEDARSARARISFELACVTSIDYMKFNTLSLYLEKYEEGQPVDPEMQALISSSGFGNSVSLLTESGKVLKADYTFEPEPMGKETKDGVTTFSFDATALPKKAGVPFVKVDGELTVGSTGIDNGDGTALDDEQKATYTAETPFWPTSNPDVRRISTEVTGSAAGDGSKVEAVWRWVRDNIKYSGPVGTRYGTVQVLSQGYGRCWDKSDVFVTLCRASGVPARQVAGWLTDKDTGHVWAEAYLEGRGWVAVDTTSDRVGVGPEYMPLFATADGAMPILYVKSPEVEEQ